MQAFLILRPCSLARVGVSSAGQIGHIFPDMPTCLNHAKSFSLFLVDLAEVHQLSLGVRRSCWTDVWLSSHGQLLRKEPPKQHATMWNFKKAKVFTVFTCIHHVSFVLRYFEY